MSEVVLYERIGKIGKITLNRPEARNAFNRELVRKLGELLNQASEDPEINVVLITAAGDKAFSAGFDIKESISDPIINVPERRVLTGTELATWRSVWNCKKPVIAACQGYVIGGGLHLAFMCDLIVAAEDAKFGEPELKFSYVPDILIEPWKLPMNKARQLLYLGEMLTAQELKECGLVNKIVPYEKLEETAMEMAEKVAAMPTDAVQILKFQVNKTYEMQGMVNAMDMAAEMFNLCRINQAQTQEAFNKIVREEGLTAALEWKKQH